MRSGLLVPAALLALLVICSSTAARGLYFTVDGGLSPQAGHERFRANWQNGLNGSVGVLLEVSSNIALVGKIEYHHFALDGANSSADWGNLRILTLGFSTRFAFLDEEDPYRPYIVFGYGTSDVALPERDVLLEDGTPVGSEYDGDDLHSTVQVGVGLEIALTYRIRLLAEARFVSLASPVGLDPTSYIPVTIGIRF